MAGLSSWKVDARLAGATAFAQSEAFLPRLLRVAGISAVPSARKGPGDDLEAGDVRVASLAERARLRLTRDGGYRSPISAAGDARVTR